MTWLDFSGIPGVTTCWKKWSRGFGGASTKKTWKQHKRKSFPDSCVLAALLMPLARSSTLCWLLIRLASWATFFSAQLQLENAEIWHNETSGGWFFPAFLKGFWFFFWGGGGWNFLGWTKPQIWLEKSWNKLMFGRPDAYDYLCSQSGPRIWSICIHAVP